MRRYELQRLFDAMGRNHRDAAEELGISGATRRRLMTEGLTEQQADRYAVRAGMAAENVWPELLDDVIAEESRECAHPDCTERFVPHPRAPHRRFCSHRCRRRYNERSARLRNLPSAERKRETRRRYYEQYGDYERARQRRYDRARKVA